jgi:hypothetical protein
MRNTLVLIAVLLLASCEGQEERPISQAEEVQERPKAPSPPPLPPLPGSNFKPIPEAEALEAAKRAGVGDCSDLQKIQGLPLKKQYGFDPYFDKIMVHIDSYQQCLLTATSSTAATRVVASYPGVQIKTVGDLAFVLLVNGEKVEWDDCTPADVLEQEKQYGSSAFYSWLNQPGSREKWHECLVSRHGT